jgi:hypothetical protein
MTKLEVTTQRKELLSQIKFIVNKQRCRSIAICKHNSILALRNSETKEITHLIDTKQKRGLINVCGFKNELYVPRYEPKTARAWLKEVDESFNKQNENVQKDCGFHFEKCILSEKELELTVMKHMKLRLQYLKFLNKMSEESLLKF